MLLYNFLCPCAEPTPLGVTAQLQSIELTVLSCILCILEDEIQDFTILELWHKQIKKKSFKRYLCGYFSFVCFSLCTVAHSPQEKSERGVCALPLIIAFPAQIIICIKTILV